MAQQKNEFYEIQLKLSKLASSMQLTNDKMQGNRFELQRNAITLRSIEADEKEGKKMYKAIGKTFILSDAATLKNELTNRNKTLESEYAALQKQAAYLKTAIADAEKEYKNFAEKMTKSNK